MRKLSFILLIVTLALTATACGSIPKEMDHVELEQETVLRGTVEGSEGRWRYAISTYTVSGDYCAEDGRVLSHHSYQMPQMKVSAGGKDNSAAARQAAEAFNSYFEERLEDEIAWFEEMGQIAGEEYALAGTQQDSRWQDDTFRYSDEAELQFWSNGRAVCITTERYSYTGGAHPTVWRDCVTFDLHTGKSIRLADLAEEPERLRDAVLEELLRQAAERLAADEAPGYYEDYAEPLADWMERALSFDDEGMTVIFPVYDLAPYAAGEQSFLIPYTFLAPYLNDAGRVLLASGE